MAPEPLDEREFELVNIVGAQVAANQRELSRQLNISLGMTNMLLRRLVTKGYIRITQLNQKKTEYLLTPKGFSEKMRKSIKYTVKTMTSMGLIKKCFKDVLSKHNALEERVFYVYGESDFAFLVEIALRDLNHPDYKVNYIKSIEEAGVEGILCICKEDAQETVIERKHINFIKELAKNNEFTNHSLKD